MKTRPIFYFLLLLIGSLKTIGTITDSQIIKGIGLASVASPLPLVFSNFRGTETFAADFRLRLKKSGNIIFDTQITSELYQKLQGPYSRRNIYGAIFAYGPMLTQPLEKVLVKSVIKQGFCPEKALAKEFELPKNYDEVEIEVHTKTRGKEQLHIFGVLCE